MDLIETRGGKEPAPEEIMEIIQTTFQGGLEKFYKMYSETQQQLVISRYEGNDDIIGNRIREYVKSKVHSPRSFEMYKLQGTPSTVIIDKEGILRHVLIGQQPHGFIENEIQKLLNV